MIGHGAHTDIIVASARAYVHALNKLEWHKRRARGRRSRRGSERRDRILVLPGRRHRPRGDARGAPRARGGGARAAASRSRFEAGLIGGAAIDAHGTPLSDDDARARARARARCCSARSAARSGTRCPSTRAPERGLLRIRKELGPVREPAPGAGVPRARRRVDAAARGGRGHRPAGRARADRRALLRRAARPARSSRAGARRATRWSTTRSEIARIARVAFEPRAAAAAT